MIKLYYRPSDMKIVHSVNGWPEKPIVDFGSNPDSSDYEMADAATEQYEAALQKAIEEAIEFVGTLSIAKLLKPGEFYEVSGEVEIVRQHRLPMANLIDCWTDCGNEIWDKDRMEFRTIARLLPDREPEKKAGTSLGWSGFKDGLDTPHEIQCKKVEQKDINVTQPTYTENELIEIIAAYTIGKDVTVDEARSDYPKQFETQKSVARKWIKLKVAP